MNQSLTHHHRRRPIHCEAAASPLPWAPASPSSERSSSFQITRIFQMLVLRTPGSQLVFFALDKGTAVRGGAQNFRSPWGRSRPLPCPGTGLGLTWPEVFPTTPLKTLRDAASLPGMLPRNSQPHRDSCQELAPSSKTGFISHGASMSAPSLASLLPL